MSKAKNRSAQQLQTRGETGPWLIKAFLCANILTQPEPPRMRNYEGCAVQIAFEADEALKDFSMFLVIAFARDKAVGRRELRITRWSDSKPREDVVTDTVEFTTDNFYLETQYEVRIPADQTAQVWFEVRLNEQLLARIPFSVVLVDKDRQIVQPRPEC